MKIRSFFQKAVIALFTVLIALAITSPARAVLLFNVIDDTNTPGQVSTADGSGVSRFFFPNFTTSGTWVVPPPSSSPRSIHRADPGDGSSVAHWTFSNLAPGHYRVAVTWPQVSTLATNAPFTVTRQGSGGSNVSDNFAIDQTKSPNGSDVFFDGTPWQTLGTFDVYGSTIDVQLTNAANGIVIADTAYIQRLDGIPGTLDDGDTGFATAGSWNTYAGAGFQGDIHRADPGDGSSTATWSFSNLSTGRYQVSVSWPQVSTLATNAPFAITRQGSNGSPATDTVPLDETQAPGDFTADGANWKTIGTFGVYGSTLNVQLSNLANGIVVADGVRIKQVAESTFVGGQVKDLFPGTYQLAARWSSGTSKPTHVRVYQTGAKDTDSVFIADIDPNAPVDFIADGFPWKIIGNVTVPFPIQSLNINYTGAQPLTRMDRTDYLPGIVDNDDTWSQIEGCCWSTYPYGSLGYQGDFRRTNPGDGSTAYRWSFPQLTPGLYQVAVTWPYASTLATNAPFSVRHLNTSLNAYVSDTVLVNQATTPNDFAANGAGWKNLGTFAVFNALDSVAFPSLSVRLTNAANGIVIADAVRVVRVGELPDGPRVDLRLDGQAISKGGSVSFGTTFPSVPISKTFTLRNIGSSDLQIGSITPPAGYTLTANVGQTTLPPGGETTFTVRLDAAGAGTYNGTLSFSTNDPNANPFQLALNGTVSTSTILDNGDAGFTTTGSWTPYVGAGFQGDIHRANPGDGSSTATWSFTNLPTGRYQVALTWPYVSSSATNAPFSVSRQGSGGTTVTDAFAVNERTTPNDFTANGAGWKTLGTFDVYGSTLTAKVTNLANGIVLADGVRIERVGNLP
jgi:hypothetical protein